MDGGGRTHELPLDEYILFFDDFKGVMMMMMMMIMMMMMMMMMTMTMTMTMMMMMMMMMLMLMMLLLLLLMMMMMMMMLMMMMLIMIMMMMMIMIMMMMMMMYFDDFQVEWESQTVSSSDVVDDDQCFVFRFPLFAGGVSLHLCMLLIQRVDFLCDRHVLE